MSESHDPYVEGREAYDTGVSETRNPYSEDSADFLTWNDGWWAGQEEVADRA